MGRNTHINELSFSLDTSQRGVQVVQFFRGLVMNRCIQRLIIFDGIVSQLEEIFFLFVPSLETNTCLMILR